MELSDPVLLAGNWSQLCATCKVIFFFFFCYKLATSFLCLFLTKRMAVPYYLLFEYF